MAGKKNAGKFFTCVDFIDPQGNKQEWKIEPIEMNVDKYISDKRKSAVSPTALQLPALV